MILTFLRSSMLGSLSLCEHRFFLDFNLNRKQKPNASTIIGSCIHSFCEALALEKLARQNGSRVVNHEYLGKYTPGEFSDPELVTKLYHEYDKEFPDIFKKDSLNLCLDLAGRVSTFKGGAYDPRNSEIFAAEYPVEITIEKPWAKYKYETPIGILDDYLKIKGTIDLIVIEPDEVYHIIDYKTGGLIDWSTGKTKDIKYMQNDKQLKLYFYAACQVFPNVRTFIITIYYIKENKPFTVIFDRKDLPEIEQFIRDTYERILSIQKPTLTTDKIYIEAFKRSVSRCKFCNHSKTTMENGQTTCEYFRDKINTDGYDMVMENFADYNSLTRYGSGGGKGDRE